MGRIPMKDIYTENKDSQLSVKLDKRLKTDLNKIAVMNRSSITDVANRALVEYVRNHAHDIENYDKVFSSKVD